MKKLLLTLAALLAVSTAHAAQPTAAEWRDHTLSLKEAGSPEAYYDQFIAQDQGDCTNPNEMSFGLIATEDVDVGTTADGHHVVASIDIFLRADHTYFVNYREMDVINALGKTWDDGFNYLVHRDKTTSGIWTVEGDVLKIGDFAVARPSIYKNKAALAILYYKDLISPDLVGRITVGFKATSNVGEHTIADVCHLN